jgi:hypothetical protein
MPYFGGPVMYPAPMSSKRAGAIASTIAMLIAAVFVLIMGIFFTVEGLWRADLWVALGVYCFLSFSMTIVGVIAIARRAWRFSALLADGMLVSCGAFSLVEFPELGILIIILSGLALVLIGVSWGQFKEQYAYQYPYPPTAPGPGAGMPAPGMGMPGPGMGMPGPVAGMPGPVRGMPPPAGMGVPPNGAGPISGGAPPPRAVPDEVEGPVVEQVVHR